MAVKLYGSAGSPYFRLVALVATEFGVPYESLDIDDDEMKAAAYLEKQPFGQIPCIDDDGFILFESRAIARYIAEKAQGTSLIPAAADLRARALFEQAASIESSNFTPYVIPLILKRPANGGTADKAHVEDALSALSGKLEGYERILAKQRYLAGEHLTLADLFHLPLGSILAKAGIFILSDSLKFPNLARWWAEISSLPSWKAVQ